MCNRMGRWERYAKHLKLKSFKKEANDELRVEMICEELKEPEVEAWASNCPPHSAKHRG